MPAQPGTGNPRHALLPDVGGMRAARPASVSGCRPTFGRPACAVRGDPRLERRTGRA